jgi:endoglycosylceramidase
MPTINGHGRIVDAEGREVLLRGVNLNAFVDYWQGGEFPIVFPFTEADADLMAAIGWNTVRLLVSWSRFEPAPDVYDPDYAEQVRDAIVLLASRGIYSIVDLHQDAWGATLAAPADTTCMFGQEPALGWDGAPAWATLDGGAGRCVPAGVRELSPAVLASFAGFFDNAAGPGGVGIRDRYVAMLSQIAAVFGAEPGVLGYDLMNEPNAFTAAQQDSLATLYGQAVQAIRSTEAAQGDLPHLILFEPSALWSAVGSGPPPDFAHDRDVVYAPHIYTGGFDGGPISENAFACASAEAKGSAAHRCCRASGEPIRTVPRRAATRTSSITSACRISSSSAHALDVARVVRRPRTRGRLSRWAHSVCVGRVRGRLHHQHPPACARI